MEKQTDIQRIILDAVEQAAEAFFITDTDGIILYANRAFEDISGYSRADLIGKKPNLLKSGKHPQGFYSELWKALKSGARWNGRIINRRRDGTYFTEEIRISPIKDRSGSVRFLAALRDVTREIQLEEQLNQSQKMESLGLLSSQISHDFNNLLTVVIGSLEVINEELQPDSAGAKLAREVLRLSRESAGRIKQLLIFARHHEAKLVPADLNEPVKELRIFLDRLLGSNVSVAYSLNEGPLAVMIEPENIKQSIINLAINSRDAMNGSGSIMIKTFRTGPEGLPPELTPGIYAALEVSDSGPGIPPEVMARIFEPFVTTKQKGKGSGLGLSSVYGIVRQNGGIILARNRENGGAIFTAYFPAEMKAAA